MTEVDDILALSIPILICVALPIAITWIVTRAKTRNRKIMSDTVLAALDRNPDINAEEILKSMNITKTITPQQRLIGNFRTGLITLVMGVGMMVLPLISDMNDELIVPGIILIAVGIGYTAAYFVGKKNIQE